MLLLHRILASFFLLADDAAPGSGADHPSDLYTVANVATLAGASALTVIISNTLQAVFNFNPKWLALVIAEALSFAGAFLTTPTQHENLPTRLFLAFINGFVIYTSAVGAQQITGKKGGDNPPPKDGVARQETVRPLTQPAATAPTRRSFGTTWF